MAEFETSFSYACPKFLSPVAPNYDTLGNNIHKVRTYCQVTLLLTVGEINTFASLHHFSDLSSYHTYFCFV